MLSLFGFIITISILVFIHEFGHYYIAKLFGMKIEIFSIGFGKELFSRIDKDGVKWQICSLPLGGYVKIYGFDSTNAKAENINSNVLGEFQELASAASNKHAQRTCEYINARSPNVQQHQFLKSEEHAGSFHNKPLHARFLTIIAGPAANYLLAIFIFTTIYCFHGKIIVPPIIGGVVAGSPAEKADLRENDRIIMVDNNTIDDFADLQQNMLLNDKKALNFTIVRSEEIVNIPLFVEGPHYVGIIAKNNPIFNKLNVFQGIYQATRDVINISRLILKTIWQMINGTRGLEFAGPITIAKESGKSLSYGISNFVVFMAMISVNLGLINLFPIPILDGGHLIFIIYEGIFRKPLSQNIKNVILKIGMLITIFLIVISISNDIKNLIF